MINVCFIVAMNNVCFMVAMNNVYNNETTAPNSGKSLVFQENMGLRQEPLI